MPVDAALSERRDRVGRTRLRDRCTCRQNTTFQPELTMMARASTACDPSAPGRFRNVEDLRHEHDVDVSHETVRLACRNVWMGSPRLVRTSWVLTVEELSGFTILVRGNRSGSGLWVSKWFKSEGAIVRRHFSSDSIITLLGMTVAGRSVTYLPLLCLAPLVSEGKLTIVQTSPELPDIPYVAMYRSDQPSAFKERVVEIARTACDFSRQLQI